MISKTKTNPYLAKLQVRVQEGLVCFSLIRCNGRIVVGVVMSVILGVAANHFKDLAIRVCFSV